MSSNSLKNLLDLPIRRMVKLSYRSDCMRKTFELSDDMLDKLAGGTCCGGPITKVCPECGNTFEAGNSGVGHEKYPLKTMCDACAAKAKSNT